MGCTKGAMDDCYIRALSYYLAPEQEVTEYCSCFDHGKGHIRLNLQQRPTEGLGHQVWGASSVLACYLEEQSLQGPIAFLRVAINI